MDAHSLDAVNNRLNNMNQTIYSGNQTEKIYHRGDMNIKFYKQILSNNKQTLRHHKDTRKITIPSSTKE